MIEEGIHSHVHHPFHLQLVKPQNRVLVACFLLRYHNRNTRHTETETETETDKPTDKQAQSDKTTYSDVIYRNIVRGEGWGVGGEGRGRVTRRGRAREGTRAVFKVRRSTGS